MNMKRTIKSVGAGLLYYGGALSFMETMKQPEEFENALTIIGYHRVLDQTMEDVKTSPLGMVVTAKMFEKQIRYLGKRYRILSLPELVEACQGGHPLPRRACLITFDDGWRDNYTVAFHILRRYGVPATIMLTSDYIGTNEAFWYARLLPMILSEDFRRLSPDKIKIDGCPDPVLAELRRLRVLNRPLQVPDVDHLIEVLKGYSLPLIESIQSNLSAVLHFGHEGILKERLMLSWDEVREMARAGIGMGSHTCTHRIMTQLTLQEALEELRRSKETIEKQVGQPVETIAFPNGACNEKLIQMVWEIGYQMIFLGRPIDRARMPGQIFRALCIHEGSSLSLWGGFSQSLFAFNINHAAGRLAFGK